MIRKQINVVYQGAQTKKVLFSKNVLILKPKKGFYSNFNTAGITLMVYYTRNKVEGPMYLASTSVVIIEFIKLIIAVIMLGYESKHFSSFILRIYYDLICQPVDMLKVSIPALLYAIQNNLIFVSLSNLDPATYQVTSQFRILTTALVMYFVLKKRLSHQQWFALFLLFLGVVFVNMKPEITQINTKTSWNYFVGLTSLLICCFCSSFAGVYFEKMLKYSSCSFWVRNMQLYIWGIVATGSNILLKDYEAVSKLGFFYGYTPSVWILIGMLRNFLFFSPIYFLTL
ncbi:UDP-N-acetylglucosamine transporter [Nymphon striatum]|nr:UDP-N-acetylglucosamine transporter [Nymphon striatum]